MKKLGLVLLLSTACCSVERSEINGVEIEPKAEPTQLLSNYINEVEGLLTDNITVPIFEMDDITVNSLGTCSFFKGIGGNFIDINFNKILYLTISPQIVILHEVGHCVYGLDHTEESYYFIDGCNAHIMNRKGGEISSSNYCWETYKEIYVQQLTITKEENKLF